MSPYTYAEEVFADSPNPPISLDCWEELIDRPEEGVGIFPATGNWAARLAAVIILTQQGFGKPTHVAEFEIEYCIKCLVILGDSGVQFCVDCHASTGEKSLL